jgi:N-acetylneuraminic acid mutarotase
MKNFILIVFALFSTTLFAQTWERQADIPSGRHHPISFSLDGKGYAVTGTRSNGQLTNDFYEYSPITDSWSTLSDFPGAARSFGIGVVANGKAYIGFGLSTTQYLRDFWSYDPTDSSWTRLADCSCSGRRHPALIAIGNRIYVGLGDDNISGNLRDWYMYDITANSWTQIANLPGPTRHHPFMFNAGGEVYAGMGHGAGIYDDWYKLDTASNTWSVMNTFPGQARVAGTQFNWDDYGFVLSGDGSNHSYMNEGEMWRYDPNNDSWKELIPHPGRSKWAPGSFVIEDSVYFFGGYNRFNGVYPTSLWKFDLTDTTTGINEKQLALTNTYVYPNPADDIVSWKNDPIITDVKVYNSLGQVLLTSAAEAKEVDVNELSNGLYFVQFYAKNELLKTSKVLINN